MFSMARGSLASQKRFVSDTEKKTDKKGTTDMITKQHLRICGCKLSLREEDVLAV